MTNVSPRKTKIRIVIIKEILQEKFPELKGISLWIEKAQ